MPIPLTNGHGHNAQANPTNPQDHANSLANFLQAYDGVQASKLRSPGTQAPLNTDAVAENVKATNVLIGPGGKDPSVMIPRLLNFLRDEDSYRTIGWEQRLKKVDEYLEEANEQRLRGDVGYEDPKLCESLEDARVMVKLHRDYQKWNHGNTRWSTDILAGRVKATRLPIFPGQFPKPVPNRARFQDKRIDPRPRNDGKSLSDATGLKLTDHAAEVESYVACEDSFFLRAAGRGQVRGCAKTPGPALNNIKFDDENKSYERCMEGGLTAICNDVPPYYPLDPGAPAGQTNPIVSGSKYPPKTHPRSFYVMRGWQRAALQKCLNTFTSHENRVINTPWRRAILPFKQPVALPKEIVWEPRVVSPEMVADHLKDPFPWVHWSNQYTQQIDYLAGWQRRRYNNENWTDFQRSALPMNFRGPYIYTGRSIYDDYWLTIGTHLERLARLITHAYGAAPRPLLGAVLRDIEAGQKGPNTDDTPVNFCGEKMEKDRLYERRDIMRRPGIDNEDGKEDSLKMVDEADIGWLRYLCEPSRNVQMCDPNQQPEENLLILFDARLQAFFRDSQACKAPEVADIWDPDMIHEYQDDWEGSGLEHLLEYMHGIDAQEADLPVDQRTRLPHSSQRDTDYQFSMDEAQYFCSVLETLGRCVYQPPSGPGDLGTIFRPTYTLHPEDRVRWRHRSGVAFEEEQKQYSDTIFHHLNEVYPKRIDDYGLGIKDEYLESISWMLDHVRDENMFATILAEKEEDCFLRDPFIKSHIVDEKRFVMGTYDEDSLEQKRQCPSWQDLAPWHDVSHLYSESKEGEPFTPERTCQFFRNLAYRMGCTLRHVNEIRWRLQYTVREDNENKANVHTNPQATPNPSGNQSYKDFPDPAKTTHPDKGTPDPANATPDPSNESHHPTTEEAPQLPLVTRWGKPISLDNFLQDVQHWTDSTQHGVGEVEFTPPTVQDVINKADPSYSVRAAHQGKDPYTIVREGIVKDCVANRQTLYPGRLSAFTDQLGNPYQGYRRPNLFDWATPAQRRYQAPYTRVTFFTMMRYPLHQQRLDRGIAIRQRKDEMARQDPNSQEVGIMTGRVPTEGERAIYGRSLHRVRPRSNFLLPRGQQPALEEPVPTPEATSTQQGTSTTAPQQAPPQKGTPITRPDQKFIPGPAIFPAGETLLQQVMISKQLENALYPETDITNLPWWKRANALWQRYAASAPPQIPLLPPVPKVLTSNPNKRKIPMEEFMGRPPKKPKTGGNLDLGGGGGPGGGGSDAPNNPNQNPLFNQWDADARARGIDPDNLSRNWSLGKNFEAQVQYPDSSTSHFDFPLPKGPRRTDKTAGRGGGTEAAGNTSKPAQKPTRDESRRSATAAGGGTDEQMNGQTDVPRTAFQIALQVEADRRFALWLQWQEYQLAEAAGQQTHNSATRKAEAGAKEKGFLDSFNKDFPRGYRTLPTPGAGMWCALYAMRDSVKAQHPNLPQPTLDNFRDPINTVLKDFADKAGARNIPTNTSNFTVDQAAAVLTAWGATHGLKFQVGYKIDGNPQPIMVSSPYDGQPDVHRVWINNNGVDPTGAEDFEDLTTEPTVNHFSAISPS